MITGHKAPSLLIHQTSRDAFTCLPRRDNRRQTVLGPFESLYPPGELHTFKRLFSVCVRTSRRDAGVSRAGHLSGGLRNCLKDPERDARAFQTSTSKQNFGLGQSLGRKARQKHTRHTSVPSSTYGVFQRADGYSTIVGGVSRVCALQHGNLSAVRFLGNITSRINFERPRKRRNESEKTGGR